MKENKPLESLGEAGTEKVKLNPLQAIYLGYSILTMYTSFYRGGLMADMSDKMLGFMCIGALVYTIIVLFYNHRYKVKDGIKVICYGAAVTSLLGCINYLIQII